MDDKAKVQLCKEIINDFYCADSGEDCGYETILRAVLTVLCFEWENDDNAK